VVVVEQVELMHQLVVLGEVVVVLIIKDLTLGVLQHLDKEMLVEQVEVVNTEVAAVEQVEQVQQAAAAVVTEQ
jgi:hypothetical protein